MGRNIDLATFTFDETKLIESITKTKQVFLALKTQQADNNKVIGEFSKAINTLIKDQDILQQSGQSNTEEYKKNDDALKILVKSQEVVIKANTALGLKMSDVNNELKEQNTALLGTAQTASGTATPYKNLNEEMNRLKLEAKNLGAELIILAGEGKKGTKEYDELEKQFIETSTKANEMNTSFKGLDGAIGDNQRNVGDYQNQIKSAFQDINIFNGGIGGFIARSQEAGGVGNLLKNSFTGISQGIAGATKASLAFLATPLGLVIGALSVIVGSLFVAFSKLDPVMDKIAQLTAGVGGAFTKATNIVADFFTNITSVGDAISKIGVFLTDPIGAIKGFAKEVAKAGKEAANLKESEQNLGDLKEIYEVRQKAITNEINLDKIKLRNKKLNGDQIKEIEDRIDNNYLKSNNMRKEVAGKTAENALKLAEQTSISLNNEEKKRLEESIRIGDLQVANELLNGERIVNGKKQVTNKLSTEGYKAIQDAIRQNLEGANEMTEKEARDQDKIDKANEKAEARREKALADLEKRRKEIADAKKKEAEDQVKNAQDLANTEIENAKLALDSYLQANQSKLTDAKRLTQDLIKEENLRLDAVLEKNRDILSAESLTKNEQLNAEIKAVNIKDGISESERLKLADLNLQKINLTNEYLLKDKQLIEATEKAKGEITKKYASQISEEKKIKQAQDFQLKLLDLETQGATEYELQVAKLDNETALALQKFNDKSDLEFQAGIEKRLEQDVLLTEEQAVKDQLNSELQTTKDENEKIRIQNLLDGITLIEKNKAEKTKQIDDAVMVTKLQAYSKVFGDIGALFGKETAAAKIAGVAQASINTYLGATQALKDPKLVAAYPLNIISAGTIIASGLQSVSKIGGFATGGLITDGQPISRRNGDDVLITAKRGEVILNQAQQLMLGGSDTFTKIGVPGFIGGGLVGSSVSSVQSNIKNSLNLESLTKSITTAVYEGSSMGTASGSQMGITNLSENRQIMQNSNF